MINKNSVDFKNCLFRFYYQYVSVVLPNHTSVCAVGGPLLIKGGQREGAGGVKLNFEFIFFQTPSAEFRAFH